MRILTRPFFVLVRNLVFFNSVERVEALIVMLWIFPDFLQVSLLLHAAQYSLRLIIGKDARYRSKSVFDMGEGRYMIWLCFAAVLATALLIAPDSVSMNLWSQRIIPIINLCYAFVVLPLVYIIICKKKSSA